jgi:hypothetical protein
MNDEETLFTDNVKEPVNVLRWILLLVTWDGVLPVLLAATPTLIRSLWPGNMLVRDFAVVTVVIVALGVRVVVGLKHIRNNYCGPWTQLCQKITLSVMAFFLVVLDCLLMTIPIGRNMPQGDQIFLATSAVIYLSCMAFVLYPGAKPCA